MTKQELTALPLSDGPSPTQRPPGRRGPRRRWLVAAIALLAIAAPVALTASWFRELESRSAPYPLPP